MTLSQVRRDACTKNAFISNFKIRAYMFYTVLYYARRQLYIYRCIIKLIKIYGNTYLRSFLSFPKMLPRFKNCGDIRHTLKLWHSLMFFCFYIQCESIMIYHRMLTRLTPHLIFAADIVISKKTAFGRIILCAL